MTEPGKRTSATYQNPVFPESFPDPFILKFGSSYYGYCTGASAPNAVFDVLRSDDLVNWERIGAAMEELPSRPPFYWAPEATYHNGKFYLYYSCGNETLMEIRVAVSHRPDGGFVDSGHRLTREEFAIDAHVFVDDDGEKYLFYATDFLGHTHIGTGTVVDKMLSWFELAGDPRPVTRAAFDWQVYDPKRVEKGGVRWHTVEGPTVFKYKKKYFQMFSGGNWKNSTYGGGFAIGNSLLHSEEWLQSIDGETVFPILKTIPEKVIGPGHNSAITGPNGRELFCVYHSWVRDARVMSIDRMDFVHDRLFVNGATFTPQPAPFKPSFSFDSPIAASIEQGWQFNDGTLTWRDAEKSAIELGCYSANLLLEFTARFDSYLPGGYFTIRFGGVAVRFDVGAGAVELSYDSANVTADIPKRLDLAQFQEFAVEINQSSIEVYVNGFRSLVGVGSVGGNCEVSIEGANLSCDIIDLFITEGFVDRFENLDASAGGWRLISGGAAIEIVDGEMFVSNSVSSGAIAVKGSFFDEFEFAANVRRARSIGQEAAFGFVLLNEAGGTISRFEIIDSEGGGYLVDTSGATKWPLPAEYKLEAFRQFRFVRMGGVLSIESEDVPLGEVNAGTFPAMIGILCKDAVVGLDMVRSVRIK